MRRAAVAARRRLAPSLRSFCTASIKSTLNLPQTTFPMHANPTKIEPPLLAKLCHEQYAWQASQTSRAPFVLHDGPPYANGDLHMGHLLNKVLKDIFNRWMVLTGRRVHFRPGWDCHGLPIELKAVQQQQEQQAASADGEALHEPLRLRAAAAECAREAIALQRVAFQRWGIMADWERPYVTMAPEYEAAQLGVLRSMLRGGLVTRGLRPVHWSPATRTALAEAELEYQDAHVSVAAYVAFPLLPAGDGAGGSAARPPRLAALLDGGAGAVAAPVWTTTPWTLPGNEAVCAHAELEYALCAVGDAEGGDGGGGPAAEAAAAPAHVVVAAARIEELEQALGRRLAVVERFAGTALDGLRCAHPLSGRPVPLLLAEHVTDSAGTGLVHTAPGHGPEDFAVGVSHALPPSCPVDAEGRFTAAVAEAAPFEGLEVLGEGGRAVLDALRARGTLLSAAEHAHRYPYDWRSKTPVIFRATPQWFCELSALQPTALASLDGVRMVPPAGRQRLEAFVGGRASWCISRQRCWGVPLPAFYHARTGEALLNDATIAHAQKLVGERGSDCWWELSEAELLPPELQPQAAEWRKGTDTLDVWFDSGCSWAAVLGGGEGGGGGGGAPLADMYLEGSDQHRGWFQSSLLTHAAAGGTGAPYGAVVTHGFVLDEGGSKMSKSLGNVVTPRDLIDGPPPEAEAPPEAAAAEEAAPKKGKKRKQKKKQPKKGEGAPWGAEVLRLWVAMSDWTRDVAVGDTVLSKAREVHRRCRNSCRFMLGNLYDYEPAHAPPLAQLRRADRYALHVLAEYSDAVEADYRELALSRVTSSAAAFVSDELSAQYFDAAKDRLYCGAVDGASRRGAQFVLHEALGVVQLSLAPVLPFLAEEVEAHRPPALATAGTLQRGWRPAPREWLQPELAREWRLVRGAKAEVARLLHAALAAKAIGSTGDAVVELRAAAGGELHAALVAAGAELNDALSVGGSRVLELAAEVGDAEDDAEEALAGGPPLDGEVAAEYSRVVADGAAHGLHVRVRPLGAPKCPRCWRHVPADALGRGEGVVVDGWTLRGCVCGTC